MQIKTWQDMKWARKPIRFRTGYDTNSELISSKLGKKRNDKRMHYLWDNYELFKYESRQMSELMKNDDSELIRSGQGKNKW